MPLLGLVASLAVPPGGMSWPELNQTVCVPRFLHCVALARPNLPERIAHAREPQQLPVVLSV